MGMAYPNLKKDVIHQNFNHQFKVVSWSVLKSTICKVCYYLQDQIDINTDSRGHSITTYTDSWTFFTTHPPLEGNLNK